jgi:hypothetical protein
MKIGLSCITRKARARFATAGSNIIIARNKMSHRCAMRAFRSLFSVKVSIRSRENQHQL